VPGGEDTVAEPVVVDEGLPQVVEDVPLMATSTPVVPVAAVRDPGMTLETLRGAFRGKVTPWQAGVVRVSAPPVVAPVVLPVSRPVAPVVVSPVTKPVVLPVVVPVASPVPVAVAAAPGDRTPPFLGGVTLRGRGREVVLTFNEPLDAATAAEAGAYRVEQITPQDYRLSTAPGELKAAVYYPRTEVPVAGVRYEEGTRSVVLSLRQSLRPGQMVAVSSAGGVRDRAGNAVDGNGDGLPDGRLSVYLPKPKGAVPTIPRGRLWGGGRLRG
jgi:hypothetical protein